MRTQRRNVIRANTVPLNNSDEAGGVYGAFGLPASGGSSSNTSSAFQHDYKNQASDRPNTSPDFFPNFDAASWRKPDGVNWSGLQQDDIQSDTLSVPRLNLVPPTPSRGSSPSLTPLQVTSSPAAMTPRADQQPDSLSQSYVQTPPSPVTPLPSPMLSADASADIENPVDEQSYARSIWKKIQPTLFPSLTEFESKSLLAKLIALVACPSILLLVLTLPVVEVDALSGQDEKQGEEFSIPPPRITVDDGSVIVDQSESAERENYWNRWLTIFQLVSAPVFVVSALTGKEHYLRRTVYM
jgi:hypothetical protein